MSYIYIGLSTPKKFHILPWLIRKVERTRFSHVYIKIYADSLDRWLIYQASGTRVNFMGQEIFIKENLIIKEFALEGSAELRKMVLQDAIDTAGTRYGVMELLGLAAVKFMAIFGKKISNPWANGNSTYVCSELAAVILVNYFGLEIKDIENITPKDIYELLDGKNS